MKKLVLTSLIALAAFTAKSQTEKDIKVIRSVLANEGVDYTDRSQYNVVYGTNMVVLYVFKQYTTRIYQMKNGYVYVITDMFPDGAKYDFNSKEK
jgi:hypothetical protein